MKKTLMILLCFSISYFAGAQDVEKLKEIGLVFSNLDNFGLTYKTGTDKSLWRFNTLFISGSNWDQTADNSEKTYNNLGFGIKLGKEYRKVMVENFELRYGADISFAYSHSKYNETSTTDNDRLDEETTYKPGINLVFGLNYKLSDSFVIGAEILPSFNYTSGEATQKYDYTNNGAEVKSDISGFSYGLSNSSVLLSLTYRFKRRND